MSSQLRMRLGWIAVAVFFFAAAVLFYIDYIRYRSGTGVHYGRAAIGAQAPDFAFRTLAGKKGSLDAFAGKPLVVNFFATWCVPCKAELPLIQSRYLRIGPRVLTVLGVDEQESVRAVRAFVAAHGVTYPVVLDDDGTAFDAYGGQAIPTSLFIDKGGVLRAVHVGEMTADMLDADLAKIL